VTAEDSSTQSYTVVVNIDQGYFSDHIGYSCYIPAGSFQYSSNSEDVCSISSAFRLSECEITRTQFSTIMGTDPSLASQSSGNNDPVQTLNWYHTIAFCNKLSIEEGLSPVYTVAE
jgi:formylglycine-generating enzyme required for sulfatase activity